MTPRWTVLAVPCAPFTMPAADRRPTCQSPGRLHPKRQSHRLERRHRPGGLTQVSCNVIENFDDESPDSYSGFALNLILTSAGTPVYFNYQDGQDTTHLIGGRRLPAKVQHPFGAGFLCRLAVPGLESRRAGFRRRRLQRDRTTLPHRQLPLWHHPLRRQHDPAGLR